MAFFNQALTRPIVLTAVWRIPDCVSMVQWNFHVTSMLFIMVINLRIQIITKKASKVLDVKD